MEQNEAVKVGEEERDEREEEIWSWGAGTEGQLGTGKLKDELLPQLIRFPSGDSVAQLACGGAHVIALTSKGKVLTWGRGTSGQLGHGEMVNSLEPKMVEALKSVVVVQVAAGWSHTGFVTDTGCLYTCGDGSFGQLGQGDHQSRSSPEVVSYFRSKHVVQVACGMRHSLVLVKGDDDSENQVFSFGSGRRGQLGISDLKIKLVSQPQSTLGLQGIRVTEIYANGDHSAALCADGELYSWGRGFFGNSDAYKPQHLDTLFQFSQICLGWNHALTLTDNKEVFMLGRYHHESSTKHFSGNSREAVLQKVDLDGVRVLQIAAGAEHSALITEEGDVLTWGWGEHGQLGFGNTSDAAAPRRVNLVSSLPIRHITCKVYCGSGFTFVVRKRRIW